MEIRKILKSELTAAQKVQSIAFRFGTDFSSQKTQAGDYEPILAAFNDSGKLCACMEVLPYEARLNTKIVKMSGIGGVATLPEERNKGYIRSLYENAFAASAKTGECISYLYPFSHIYYRKFGYELCTHTEQAEIEFSAFRGLHSSGSVNQYFPGDSMEDIISIYNTFSRDKNFMVSRTRKSWENKLNQDPYKNNRSVYVWHNDSGKPSGYVILKPGDSSGELFAEELIWTDASSLRGILGFIKAFSGEYRKFVWFAPAFLNLRLLFDEPYLVHTSANCMGMCRILDMEQALLTLPVPEGSGSFSIDINDSFIPQDSGVYRFCWSNGQASVSRGNFTPDAACGIETAAQLITGYASPLELEMSGKMEIRSGRETLSMIFTKKTNYICDQF